MENFHTYAACEVRGPNLIIARRCRVCGALATTPAFDGRVMGALPSICRLEHGNETVEIPVEVPNAPPRRCQECHREEGAGHELACASRGKAIYANAS